MKIEEILVQRGYSINKDGQCFNPKGKLIKGRISTGGYYNSAVRVDKKYTPFYFHRFVAYTKFGDKIYEKGIEVRHLDGNSKNNKWDNIEIGTRRDNFLDIPAERRMEYALNATSAIKVYSDDLVKDIRAFRDKGATYKQIMDKFGISSKGTLYFILNNRRCLKY